MTSLSGKQLHLNLVPMSISVAESEASWFRSGEGVVSAIPLKNLEYLEVLFNQSNNSVILGSYHKGS